MKSVVAWFMILAFAAAAFSTAAGGEINVEGLRFVKAELTCDADNMGYFIRARVPDDIPDNPANPADVMGCGISPKTKLTDKQLRNPWTYNLLSALKPYGKTKGDGAITSGRIIKVVHKSRIRRGAFVEPTAHLSSAQYLFQVPDIGEQYTPVRVTAIHKTKGELELIQNHQAVLGLSIYQEGFVQYTDLTGLDGEALVELQPGEYLVEVNAISRYTSTGPQDAKGLQPKYFRAYKITVEVPLLP